MHSHVELFVILYVRDDHHIQNRTIKSTKENIISRVNKNVEKKIYRAKTLTIPPHTPRKHFILQLLSRLKKNTSKILVKTSFFSYIHVTTKIKKNQRKHAQKIQYSHHHHSKHNNKTHIISNHFHFSWVFFVLFKMKKHKITLQIHNMLTKQHTSSFEEVQFPVQKIGNPTDLIEAFICLLSKS